MTRLTRNQRRQIEKLQPHVDRLLETDRAFFNQHPDRLHRVRPSSDVEIAQLEVARNKLLRAPEGHRWFTVIKKVPGARLRIFVTNKGDVEVGLDVPEKLAAEIFEAFAPPGVRAAEDALRAKGGAA